MIKARVVASRIATIGLLVLTVGACDVLGPDDPSGPGALTVTLVSPVGKEASALFEVTGGVDLGTVSPLGGEVFYQHFGGSTRIVVVMDEPGEVRFQVRTEDVGILPEVTVVEVASGENELRTSLSGYSVRFVREKDSPKMGRGG